MQQIEPSELSPAAGGGEYRAIVAGFGGQGILTLGRLLCTAAMADGRQVTYLPSYGTEVRGGTANCQVVVSDGTIYSPLVEEADALIILNQLSYERFLPRLNSGGLLVVNSSGVDLEQVPCPPGARRVCVPAAERAAELGDVRVGNVLMLGAFTQASSLVSRQSCEAALETAFSDRKADLLDVNKRALAEGVHLAAEAQHA